jgi:ABC-type branched-subunit amino acid transport system ATPase component
MCSPDEITIFCNGADSILHAKDLTKRLGGITGALGGHIGAGKTTTVKTIFGMLPALGGSITISGKKTRKIRRTPTSNSSCRSYRSTLSFRFSSGARRRMVSLRLAMMSGPTLFLLDEPSLGLALGGGFAREDDGEGVFHERHGHIGKTALFREVLPCSIPAVRSHERADGAEQCGE